MNPGAWITGGDGICRMKWQVPTLSIAAGAGIIEEECGGPATEPVTYFREPHLICIACKPKFMEKAGAAEMDMGPYDPVL